MFILTLLTLAAIATSFYITGSPLDKRALELDSTRVEQIRKISNAIKAHYSKNDVLPENLAAISKPSLVITDPETKKQYEYKVLTPLSYNLCTTFSRDAQKVTNSGYDFNGLLDSLKHTKGYYCYEYTVEEKQINPYQPPTQQQRAPSVSGTFITLPAELSETQAVFGFNYTGTARRYRVDLSTVPDMSSDVYLNFGSSNGYTITVNDPTKWDKYTCDKILYWKVVSIDTNTESEIQTATVRCN